MQVEQTDTDAYAIRFADATELVDVYTRQLAAGELFVPLEKDHDPAESDYALCLHLPRNDDRLQLRAQAIALEPGPPRGVRFRILSLDDATRSQLEAYLTELVRGDVPARRFDLEEAPEERAPRAADRALAFQEEATGRALDGRSIQAQLREMSHGDRIRLALTGGKAARAALIRNPQPVYHAHVVQNPRITRAELAAIARNPNVSPEALRAIAANAQHVSDPQVRLALVKNPKTDAQIAQKLLARLPQPQLRQIARSDDVRANLRAAAVRLLARS